MSEDLKLRHRQLQQEISEINKQPFRQGQTYDHEPKP